MVDSGVIIIFCSYYYPVDFSGVGPCVSNPVNHCWELGPDYIVIYV